MHILRTGLVLLALLLSFNNDSTAEAPDIFFKVNSASGLFVGAWYVAPPFWDETNSVSCSQCSEGWRKWSGSTSENSLTASLDVYMFNEALLGGAHPSANLKVDGYVKGSGTVFAQIGSWGHARNFTNGVARRRSWYQHPVSGPSGPIVTNADSGSGGGAVELDIYETYEKSSIINLGCGQGALGAHPDFPAVRYHRIDLAETIATASASSFAGLLHGSGEASYTLTRGEARPVAVIGGAPAGEVPLGTNIQLQSSDSYDPDNSESGTEIAGICNRYWTVTRPDGSQLTSSSHSMNVLINQPGQYTIELEVVDDEGDTDIAFAYINADRERTPCPGDDPAFPVLESLSCVDDRTQIRQNVCGNVWTTFSDPVATRGHPIATNVHLNSQSRFPGRLTAVGSASFTYGMAVLSAQIQGEERWFLIDGNGAEHDFGRTNAQPAAPAGVYSTLIQTASGFELSGAGAPENIHRAGNFRYEFDTDGKLLSLTDPQGNLQTISYNSNGSPVQVDDVSTNKWTRFEYDTPGRIARIVENGGGTVTHITYSANKITELTTKNGAGETVLKNTISYNSSGLQESITRDDKPESTITFSYEDSGSSVGGEPLMLANYSSNMGSSNLYYAAEPPAGMRHRLTKTNAQGGETHYDFSQSTGLLARVISPPFTGSSEHTVYSFEYDSNFNITSVSDGATTQQMSYTPNGLIEKIEDPLGNFVSYEYAGVNLRKIQDNIGVKLEVLYHDPNQPNVPTSLIDGDGNEWQSTLNSYGQVLTQSPPTGSPVGETNFTYDESAASASFGYLTSVTDALNNSSHYTYTDMGDVQSVTTIPAPGIINSTSFTYDAAQRVTQITHSDGKTQSYQYSGRDLATFIDEAGTAVDFSWCAVCGQMTGLSGPLGRSLSWGLNSDRQTVSFSDPRGGETSYIYGLAGELDEITYPDNTWQNYKYDQHGRLVRINRGSTSASSILEYDAAGRLSRYGEADFTYNQDGSIAEINDAVGRTKYAYTPSRLPKSVRYKYDAAPINLAREQHINYTYNPDQSLASMEWLNGSSVVASWNYHYDAAGRLVKIKNSFNETTLYEYDGEGKIISQTNSNGTSTQYRFNHARSWPTAITQNNNRGTFADYQLSYDNGSNTIGNLTRVDELDGSIQNYTYDSLYRLTQETKTGSTPYTKSYDYDLSGNIESIDGNFFGTYDLANKISSIAGGSSSYDQSGNLTAISGNGISAASYQWDNRNRMTRQTQGSTHIDYHYDTFSRRIASRPQSSNSSRTIFIYDGTRVIGELSGSTGMPTAAYTWGPDGLVSRRTLSNSLQTHDNFHFKAGLEEVAVSHLRPESHWYHFGPQGETRQLTNERGRVVATYNYTAYGEKLSSTGNSIPNPYQYGGKYGYYTESSTGLMLAWHRWYSPDLKRWLSRDPIGYDGGTNLYEYVRGNPIRYVDPTGLTAECPLTIEGCKNDPDTWVPYHGGWLGACLFHCCGTGYLENRVPIPYRNPQGECFYDSDGNLITNLCRGTANDFDSKRNPIAHSLFDRGGMNRPDLGYILIQSLFMR